MPQWKPEDDALFAELCRRAEQQSRGVQCAATRAASGRGAPDVRLGRGRCGGVPRGRR